MLLVLKPFVMAMWRSRAFKELIVAMLEKIVTRTDNDLDDLAVSHLKDLLLPYTRVEKLSYPPFPRLAGSLPEARSCCCSAPQWSCSSLDTALA